MVTLQKLWNLVWKSPGQKRIIKLWL